MFFWYSKLSSKKAEVIDAIIDLDITVDGNEMSDQIWEGLKPDFHFTDFLIYRSLSKSLNYYRFIIDILACFSTPSFKMKYGKRAKSQKASFVSNSWQNYKKAFCCDYCKKAGIALTIALRILTCSAKVLQRLISQRFSFIHLLSEKRICKDYKITLI